MWEAEIGESESKASHGQKAKLYHISEKKKKLMQKGWWNGFK
jgi:hypothetical protein